MIRKLSKIHTDKFTDEYKPETKSRNPVYSSSDTISDEQITRISKNILPAWKNASPGYNYSRLMGLVYDNIPKCPKSEYNYLLNLSERLKIMDGSKMNESEIALSCRDYLKKVNVEIVLK